MKTKEKEEQQIFKINKKNNFFVILSKQNCEQFCSNIFFFVLLQIVEIVQMIYFTFSAPIIGVASSSEDLLISIQNLLKYSHFTVSYRKNDGTFTSLGPLNYENIFIIFSVYTLLFTIIAIVTVKLENLNDERLKKTICRLSSITSIMFYLNFFILSFPTYQLYFIPFECLMNSNSPSFQGNPYYCYDSKHIIFLLISVVGLVIWIVFNCVFSLYVNEYFPESNIPWTGQVTKNNFILFLWKFFASVFLFMSQNGLNRIFIIGIIVVNLVNILIRYRTPFMFKEVVHFFYSIRECVIFTFTIINYIKYISGISFDFSFLLITIFITFAFVFLFFRLNDKEQRKIQLSDPFKLKEVNEVELYVMYLMNKIEHIENINYRKDIYGMFLIHQENCEITELFDTNIELDYRCPCQEIVTYLKLLNFHINFHGHNETKTSEKDEKKMLKDDLMKDGQVRQINSNNVVNDVMNLIPQMKEEGKKQKKRETIVSDNKDFPLSKRKGSNVSNNIYEKERLDEEDKKISSEDLKEDEDEEKLENSENKAMMMKDYYNKAFEKLKHKLFVYVKYLLIYHINNKPNTTKLHLLYSYLNHKKLSRQYKSLYELMQAKYSKGTYIDRFLVFRYTEILEEDINDQNTKKERDYSIDMKELIKFVLNYKTFFDVMEQVAHNSVEFWQEFDNEHPNTVKIYKTGDSIANDYYKLAKYKEYFSETYYNHFAINFTYGCFLKFILNNYKEASIIIHNAVLSKTKNEATTSISDIRLNEEVGLIIISGDLLSFGQMVYMNNNLALMIKFNSKELINANVNILLPKFIASKHDKCIKYFLETGEKRILDKDVVSFTKNKEGFMCPVKQKVRMIPNLTSGLKFISNIVKLETTSEILQPNPDLMFNDIFIMIISPTYSILGVTENTSKFLGISFCNHTEKKFKDLSLENFFTNFEKIKKYFELTKSSTPSDQIDVEIDTTVMKDVIDITENPNIVFGKKKMRMVIQKYQYYKKQIKYYVLKLWDNENKPKPKMTIVDKNIDNTMAQNFDFEENGSIISANSLNGEEAMNDNGNQSYSQSASDEKSSFLQSENVDDPTISSFQKFIFLLIFPFFCLIIIDYVLFYNNNKSHIVSYDNNIIRTAITVERLFLLSRLHLNSISGLEPIKFTKNDFKSMDKLNFTKYNIQNYVTILSSLITDVIQNPIYYYKKLNYTDIDFVMIDSDSNFRTLKSPLYKYISDFNTYAAVIINYDINLKDKIISNFGTLNNSNSHNLIERQNYFFLANTLRTFLEDFWMLIYSDISLNENSLLTAWILPNVFLIIYCVLYLCILILILYFSFKIKRRKTLYIDYFTQIEECEITNLKDNCVKFFKFLHGEIIFKDILHKDLRNDKGDLHDNDVSIHEKEQAKKEEISPEKTDLLSESNNKNMYVPEFKLEKMAKITENSKSGNKIENDNASNNFQLLSSNNPSNILKTQETHHHTPILENMKNKIDKKSDLVSPGQQNIIELKDMNEKKETRIEHNNTNEHHHHDKKKKKVETNQNDGNEEIVPAVEEKTPKEIKLENKKKWIIESSKNDKNQVYYFLIGLVVLFVLFDYLFYDSRSNQIKSFETVEQISLHNFQREADLLNFINYGKEIISFNLDRNDDFYANFTRLKYKLAKLTEDEFLLMKNKTTYSFLSNLILNDEKSTMKNNYCQVLSDFSSKHFTNFLTDLLNQNECETVNNGILQNGILYYIHDVKNIYEETINKYLIQPQNLTFAKALLSDEFTNTYPFIYLKYVAIFFDYFNYTLITSYLEYITYLSRISFVLILFFIILVFVAIYSITKLFSKDIKNARGIICVIPSKYLKTTSQKQKENQEG